MQSNAFNSFTLATLTILLASCASEGPELEGGADVGETGEKPDPIAECAPFDDDQEYGSTFTCRGEGNG